MTTVYPLKFQIGPLELTGFGLMMMAAFLIGGWLVAPEDLDAFIRSRMNVAESSPLRAR